MRIDTATILFEEIEKTRLKVIANIQANKQNVTGKTAQSLYTEATQDTGILWGADHISTLETGISPFQSRQNPFRDTFYGLREWYQAKGISRIDIKTDRRIFQATINQREIGSVLFRKTGGKPTGLVYGKEVNPLTQNIKQRITDAILDIKIIQ